MKILQQKPTFHLFHIVTIQDLRNYKSGELSSLLPGLVYSDHSKYVRE